MSIVQVKDLKKSYKSGFWGQKHQVLHGVNFAIESSTITGFLGGNGAGKTTTMKCMLGLNIPDSGKINFFDQGPLTAQLKSRIGFLPERPYFYDYLTGFEFLQFYGEISGKFKTKAELKERINQLLKKVNLEFAKDKALRDYSKGMLQKIGLAQALVHRPEFVILDEPMAGLDPDGRHYLSELINETARQGTAIFFSSHLLHDTERLCENLIILKGGHVAFNGKTHQMINNLNTESTVKFQKAGELFSEAVENGQNLNHRLQELLKSGYEIQSVTPKLIGLEEAFIDFAMKEHRQ